MAGLVAYASSDEEEEEGEVEVPAKAPPSESAGSLKTAEASRPRGATPPDHAILEKPVVEEVSMDDVPAAVAEDAQSAGAVMIGPARPDGAVSSAALPALDEEEEEDGLDGDEPPLSPESAERALVRQLTMPRVPDFALPGSPPDTPPAGAAALDAKLATFLTLKRDKGTHFNARLAQSAAMKNPAVMDKLMAFVGLDAVGPGSETGAGTEQYETVLSGAVWNPAADAEGRQGPVFPAWAYRQQLRKVQEEQGRQRARVAGERVEFVPAASVTGKRRSRE